MSDGCKARSTAAAAAAAAVRVRYNEWQLDVLALLLTATKLLFLEAALGPAAQLAEVVAPAVAASDVPLHATHIRNEVAYFRCIQKVTVCGHALIGRVTVAAI